MAELQIRLVDEGELNFYSLFINLYSLTQIKMCMKRVLLFWTLNAEYKTLLAEAVNLLL